MSSDLIDFVLARLAEDAQVAEEALRDCGEDGAGWAFTPPATVDLTVETLELGSRAMAEHIARQDPARVRARCMAQKLMIGHAVFRSGVEGDAVATYLALGYADHPDYLDEWRP